MLKRLRNLIFGDVDPPTLSFTDEEERAVQLGREAHARGDKKNPFSAGTPRHAAWKYGWDEEEFKAGMW
ncbi:hypothetical protein SAMN05443245_5268 [Paraburkholderia fungorum]|uniref:Uncharacterized protein n=1 Tax=Paraburkholderia fungorum TaxID=134537 RepID=A0A1H1IJE4_9BURK|nr:hypothetical protein [Paraburkholderia fungorum]SDR37802.1 hypothetical protein SAMN05443245_5268 [Paraburkholderia fungorum]